MDTTLYYTFSTISQSLASAIGLLGAFVLFRLQSTDSELDDVGITVLNCYSASPEREAFGDLYNARRYADMVAFAETHPYTDPSARTSYVASKCRRLAPLVIQRRSVHRWLRIALLNTMCLIASSVAVLALTPRLATIQSAASVALVAGWLWLVLCLAVYAQLLRATIGSEPT